MKELSHYILKKSAIIIACLFTWAIPFHLMAQEDQDSTRILDDTLLVSPVDDDYSTKPAKYPAHAVFRSVPDTTVERMKREKEFAYANDPAYWIKEKKVHRKNFLDYAIDFFESGLIRVIFYILLAALIIFVLYRIIVVNDLFIFYSSKKQRKITQDATLGELDPGLIDKNIQDAIDQKHYNTAVRYLYLKTLQVLNDKNFIQYHSQATNSEYLKQMSQHKRSREFRFLTQVYEYVWYGEFGISEQQFSLVYHNFKNFHAAMS